MTEQLVNEVADRARNWQEYGPAVARRRWWFLGPFFACGLLGIFVAHVWPPMYRSEATILVEQQKVPEQYVMPNVVTSMQERLEAMTQQILSRTRLRKIIEQFDLYPRERRSNTMDEVIDKMRTRIGIQLVQAPGRGQELTAFRISYETDNPVQAQRIVNEVTSLFIEQNLDARAQQSAGTTSFLENQLESARKDLAEQEKRLGEYKMRYLGELPEQQQSNLQILGSLEAQLHSTTDQLSRAEQQKIYLSSLRNQLQSNRTMTTVARDGSTIRLRPDEVLQNLRRQLNEAEAKYTPKHPDVLALKDQIAEWEGRARGADPAPAGGKPGPSQIGEPGDPNLIEVESRLKAVDAQIVAEQKEAADLRRRSRDLQNRLNVTPVREQQLAEVTRNYENSRQAYQSLLQKKMQSELASNLERRQQGEQFRLIDPPDLPQKPVEPDRGQIVLGGWIAGLCLGLGLAAFREITDSTLRREEDIAEHLRIPLLTTLPLLRSAQQAQVWRQRLQWEMGGVAFLVVLSVSGSLYSYLAG